MKSIGYLQLFRQNSNFRKFYGAHLISLFGDWCNVLAMLSLLRSMGHEDAGSFGGIFIAKSVATLMMLPLGGVVVDRFSRKSLMFWTDIGRALIVCCFFAAPLLQSVFFVYVLLWMQAILGAFFEPAKHALLPDIVTKEELPAASAINAVTWSTMLSLGTAIGGYLADNFGWQAALSVDVSSYLISAALVFFLIEPPFTATYKEFQVIQPFVDGWQYIRNRFSVGALILVKMMWGVMGSVSVMLAMLGEGKYKMAAGATAGVSLLYMARGIGTGLGPFIAKNFVGRDAFKAELTIGLGFLFGGLFYMPLALMDNIWSVACLVTSAHLGGSVIWVFSTQRLQQLVPTEIRGRVFSWDLLGFLIVHCIAIWLYSEMVDSYQIEPDVALAWGGAFMMIPTGLWFAKLYFYGVEDAVVGD